MPAVSLQPTMPLQLRGFYHRGKKGIRMTQRANTRRTVHPLCTQKRPARPRLHKLCFYWVFGGRGGTRTPDPLLAKQVLCQLSYTPKL